MKKLLILLLVLSSCVVNRYTCSCDHTCAFEPGAVTNLPILEIGKVTPKIFWEHNTWNTFLAKSGTVVWSPLATDTTLTKNKLIIKQ